MIKVECLGIGDMFGIDSESAMILDIDGYIVALEAPFKINKYSDTNLIDCIIWTHNDPDHIAGLSTFLFNSKWGLWRDSTPIIVSTAMNISDFWAANYKYMGINRDSGDMIPLNDYAYIGSTSFGSRMLIPLKPALEIETFKRSNYHGPFDTMAFKLWYKDKCVIAYSGDTRFDPELIHWMYEGSDTHPIIHEAGGGAPVHTCISDLRNLNIDHSRLFVNHINDLEFVLGEIEDCPIRLASELAEI